MRRTCHAWLQPRVSLASVSHGCNLPWHTCYISCYISCCISHDLGSDGRLAWQVDHRVAVVTHLGPQACMTVRLTIGQQLLHTEEQNTWVVRS